MLLALFGVLDLLLRVLSWIVILQVVLSWLIAFNVINTRNSVVYMIGDFLERVTEPLLRPVRSILPSLGGIDISPIVVILLLVFAQNLLVEYGLRAAYYSDRMDAEASREAIARTLRRLEEWWIGAGFPPTIPDAIVDQAVADAVAGTISR